ncbi:hypothetical protein MVEN_00225800 [Mycena venus]|uniref:Uncharacterized protein n=1 Tax=Mycena venus TaxID=2733690 RepID=A0A8H6Z1K9_9AGAR|nr:hypothetical protein MVEN_00225800 [Mycena venus]
MAIPSAFFDGCTNFEISGGTFNDVRGNLNQRRVNHYNVQYNNVNGNLTRYNSPTIVNFGGPAPMFNHNTADPPPPRRGAGRGNYAVRMEPYSTVRGSEPIAQIPAFRPNRIPSRGGVPSPHDANPSQASPSPNRERGVPPRARSTQNYLSQPSGSTSGPLNGRRRGDSWAYSPPPMPSFASPFSYRDEETMSDSESLQSEDESDDESGADVPSFLPSENAVAPEVSSDSAVGQHRRSF